jgi:hypothetical protein
LAPCARQALAPFGVPFRDPILPQRGAASAAPALQRRRTKW